MPSAHSFLVNGFPDPVPVESDGYRLLNRNNGKFDVLPVRRSLHGIDFGTYERKCKSEPELDHEGRPVRIWSYALRRLVEITGARPLAFLSAPYHTIIALKWPYLFAAIASIFLIVNVFFAIIYLLPCWLGFPVQSEIFIVEWLPTYTASPSLTPTPTIVPPFVVVPIGGDQGSGLEFAEADYEVDYVAAIPPPLLPTAPIELASSSPAPTNGTDIATPPRAAETVFAVAIASTTSAVASSTAARDARGLVAGDPASPTPTPSSLAPPTSPPTHPPVLAPASIPRDLAPALTSPPALPQALAAAPLPLSSSFVPSAPQPTPLTPRPVIPHPAPSSSNSSNTTAPSALPAAPLAAHSPDIVPVSVAPPAASNTSAPRPAPPIPAVPVVAALPTAPAAPKPPTTMPSGAGPRAPSIPSASTPAPPRLPSAPRVPVPLPPHVPRAPAPIPSGQRLTNPAPSHHIPVPSAKRVSRHLYTCNWRHAYYYSVQTWATIGYGYWNPQSLYGNIVGFFQAFCYIVYGCFWSVSLYHKVCRPSRARHWAAFSTVAVINEECDFFIYNHDFPPPPQVTDTYARRTTYAVERGCYITPTDPDQRALLPPGIRPLSLSFRYVNRWARQQNEMQITVMLFRARPCGRVPGTQTATIIEPEFTLLETYTTKQVGRMRGQGPSNPLGGLPITVVHNINADSPLFGASLERLRRERAEIIVVVDSTDESVSDAVAARWSYTLDEVLLNYRFLPMVSAPPGSGFIVSLPRLSLVEPTPPLPPPAAPARAPMRGARTAREDMGDPYDANKTLTSQVLSPTGEADQAAGARTFASVLAAADARRRAAAEAAAAGHVAEADARRSKVVSPSMLVDTRRALRRTEDGPAPNTGWGNCMFRHDAAAPQGGDVAPTHGQASFAALSASSRSALLGDGEAALAATAAAVAASMALPASPRAAASFDGGPEARDAPSPSRPSVPRLPIADMSADGRSALLGVADVPRRESGRARLMEHTWVSARHAADSSTAADAADAAGADAATRPSQRGTLRASARSRLGTLLSRREVGTGGAADGSYSMPLGSVAGVLDSARRTRGGVIVGAGSFGGLLLARDADAASSDDDHRPLAGATRCDDHDHDHGDGDTFPCDASDGQPGDRLVGAARGPLGRGRIGGVLGSMFAGRARASEGGPAQHRGGPDADSSSSARTGYGSVHNTSLYGDSAPLVLGASAAAPSSGAGSGSISAPLRSRGGSLGTFQSALGGAHRAARPQSRSDAHASIHHVLGSPSSLTGGRTAGVVASSGSAAPSPGPYGSLYHASLGHLARDGRRDAGVTLSSGSMLASGNAPYGSWRRSRAGSGSPSAVVHVMPQPMSLGNAAGGTLMDATAVAHSASFAHALGASVGGGTFGRFSGSATTDVLGTFHHSPPAVANVAATGDPATPPQDEGSPAHAAASQDSITAAAAQPAHGSFHSTPPRGFGGLGGLGVVGDVGHALASTADRTVGTVGAGLRAAALAARTAKHGVATGLRGRGAEGPAGGRGGLGGGVLGLLRAGASASSTPRDGDASSSFAIPLPGHAITPAPNTSAAHRAPRTRFTGQVDSIVRGGAAAPRGAITPPRRPSVPHHFAELFAGGIRGPHDDDATTRSAPARGTGPAKPPGKAFDTYRGASTDIGSGGTTARRGSGLHSEPPTARGSHPSGRRSAADAAPFGMGSVVFGGDDDAPGHSSVAHAFRPVLARSGAGRAAASDADAAGSVFDFGPQAAAPPPPPHCTASGAPRHSAGHESAARAAPRGGADADPSTPLGGPNVIPVSAGTPTAWHADSPVAHHAHSDLAPSSGPLRTQPLLAPRGWGGGGSATSTSPRVAAPSAPPGPASDAAAPQAAPLAPSLLPPSAVAPTDPLAPTAATASAPSPRAPSPPPPPMPHAAAHGDADTPADPALGVAAARAPSPTVARAPFRAPPPLHAPQALPDATTWPSHAVPQQPPQPARDAQSTTLPMPRPAGPPTPTSSSAPSVSATASASALPAPPAALSPALSPPPVALGARAEDVTTPRVFASEVLSSPASVASGAPDTVGVCASAPARLAPSPLPSATTARPAARGPLHAPGAPASPPSSARGDSGGALASAVSPAASSNSPTPRLMHSFPPGSTAGDLGLDASDSSRTAATGSDAPKA